MKLSYKIFAAFLITWLAIADLTIVILHFLGRRIFVNYVEKMQTEELANLTEMLISEWSIRGMEPIGDKSLTVVQNASDGWTQKSRI